MNNSICPIILFYNDLEGIRRLHTKLKEHKICSIWADGRFHDFKKIRNSDNSTDGSLEYLDKQLDCIVLRCEPLLEYEKLTRLLHLTGDIGYKYAILLSCDELPVGSFDELVKNLDNWRDEPQLYRLNFTTETKKDIHTHSENFVERVFRYPNRFNVNITHWSYYIDDNKKVTLSPKKAIKGITIHHDLAIRNKDREEMMTEYQKIQKVNEHENYYIRKQGLESTPTLEGLTKLFPDCKIGEKGRYFIIQGEMDTTKLPVKWFRYRILEGLCVMK